ncbi:MAG: hypothetical protein K2W82_16785 [Candidatus Obscuribacterales bacterium]|nr:hypothetical protein [Candidatus Obscuribacterales bacterium]
MSFTNCFSGRFAMRTTTKSFAALNRALAGFGYSLADMVKHGVDLDALNDHFIHAPEPLVFLAAFIDALDEDRINLEDFNGRLDLEELTTAEARLNCGVYTQGLLALNEDIYHGLPDCPFKRVLIACYDEPRCRTTPRKCAANRSLACLGESI